MGRLGEGQSLSRLFLYSWGTQVWCCAKGQSGIRWGEGGTEQRLLRSLYPMGYGLKCIAEVWVDSRGGKRGKFRFPFGGHLSFGGYPATHSGGEGGELRKCGVSDIGGSVSCPLSRSFPRFQKSRKQRGERRGE